MRIATAHLKSNSPYSQTQKVSVDKKPKESPDDYEKRTWRERLHANADGNVFIPPMAFKNCLSDCAKFIGEQIPGRGKERYTKHFEAGIMVFEPLVLPIKKVDVPGQWLFVPADGKRGGGKRVNRCFPVIHEWEGKVAFYILDSTITKDVFERHLKEAGNFIGIGYFRPSRNGYWGRFTVKSVEWAEVNQNEGDEE